MMFPNDPEGPGTDYGGKVNFKLLILLPLPCEQRVYWGVSKPTLMWCWRSNPGLTHTRQALQQPSHLPVLLMNLFVQDFCIIVHRRYFIFVMVSLLISLFKEYILFSKHYRDFPRLCSQEECVRLLWFFLNVGLNSKSTWQWTLTVYAKAIFVVSDRKRIKIFHCPRTSQREDTQREEETGGRCHMLYPNASFPRGTCPSSYLPHRLPLTQQAGSGRPCGFHSRFLPPQDDPVPTFQRRKALVWGRGHWGQGEAGGAGGMRNA